MNILIIGNGFDLAHNLPTTYTNFLNFTEQMIRAKNFYGTVTDFESKIDQTGYDKFNDLDESVREYIHSKISDSNKPQAKVNEIVKFKNDQIMNEIISLAEGNTWIEWVKSQKEINGSKWIDFEEEISKVVQHMELIYKKKGDYDDNSKPGDNKNIFSDFEKGLIKHFSKSKDSSNFYSNISECKDIMLDDLNNLIRCLELYLEDCVRNIDKKLLSSDIYNLNVDKVLSFNYTDTYKRIYSGKYSYVEYDYIHGKSHIDENISNNMVLGIDEYLTKEEQLENVNFIEFKKYFQRIHKMTGCKYKQWLNEINESRNNDDNNAYFFGHSLAKTDKDVLLEILNNPKITTTIFYRNKKHYAELIANLVLLLGADEVTSRVYGVNPKIIFKIQDKMSDIQNSEWEIINDCRSLWKLYTFCDKDIDLLIKKIQKMIDEQDLKYFNCQRNVISLYDALLNNYEIESMSQLLDIAKKLYIPDNCDNFSFGEWGNYDYLGRVLIPEKTCEFITEVNNFNRNKHEEKDECFDFNDLHQVYNKIKRLNLDENRSMECLKFLFSLLKEESTDIELIWKCIFLLIDNISKEKIDLFIEEGLSSADAMDKVRYKWLKDVNDENCYYRTMAENQTQEDEYMQDIK